MRQSIHCLFFLFQVVRSSEDCSLVVPEETLAPFGSYPNPLDLTESDRSLFHPVVKFPIRRPPIVDFTQNSTATTTTRQLATEVERLQSCKESKNKKKKKNHAKENSSYGIGRYDENRVSLYSSALFDDTDNEIDGYKGKRTIHIGIDLNGPVHTPVYAFYYGTVHAVGYNEALGDYGNVVVVKHELPRQATTSPSSSTPSSSRFVYALYGHLDDTTSTKWRRGQRVRKGQLLGRMGNVHENGGWFIPHVHFQLSILPPTTHDMPGVVSLEDRAKALVDYPDPRYILGDLY